MAKMVYILIPYSQMRTKEEIEKIYDCYEEKLSQNQAAKLLGISRTTIKDYYKRFKNNISVGSVESLR